MRRVLVAMMAAASGTFSLASDAWADRVQEFLQPLQAEGDLLANRPWVAVAP